MFMRPVARRSVSRVLSRPMTKAFGRGWPFIWDVRYRTPRATDPSGGAEGPPGCANLGQRRLPLLLGLAPGGVYPAAAVAGGAVRSYRTISPLPPAAPEGGELGGVFLWHFPWGRPRRALPGTVPPWSPDFPPSAERTRRRAAIRPSDWKDLGWRAPPVKPPSERNGVSANRYRAMRRASAIKRHAAGAVSPRR